QAMVALGDANSRMKDFYDIWSLSKSEPFEGDRLARAIAATFARRNTPIPALLPLALTPEFACDPLKRDQWNAFAADVLTTPITLEKVAGELAVFIAPHLVRARDLG